MRLPFNGSYPITQIFNDSCCRAAYKRFGMTGHNGIDYGLPCGTDVVSPINGSVYYFWDPNGYGNAVFIRGEGVEVVLGHLSSVDVRSGNVSAGQRIGRSGTTGNSTGCHLHFGVRKYPGYNNSNGFFGYDDPNQYLGGSGGGEMAATAEQVDKIFRAFLGRPGDPNSTYIGLPLDRVLNEVSSSPEAGDYARYLASEVQYNGLLMRPGTSAEVNTGYAANPPVKGREMFDITLNSAERQAVVKQYNSVPGLHKQIEELQKKLAETGNKPVDPNTITVSKDGVWEAIKRFFNIK